MGGFSFYGGVVVTVGSMVIDGGGREFGFVTQQVTFWLNLAGSISLLYFFLSAWMDLKLSAGLRWTHRLIFLSLLLVSIGQIILWIDHSAMDRRLDIEHHVILDKAAYRLGHKVYILTSTAMWGLCLGLLWLTIYVWRAIDRQSAMPCNGEM